MPVELQSPIWCGPTKQRSVGIAEHRLGQHYVDVEILYKNKDGVRIYPHLYTISREKLLKYPLQIKNSVRIRIVPINDLCIREWRKN